MTMATIDSPVFPTIVPVTHDLGSFRVHRTLPARERTMVGPFIFVDEFGPAQLEPGQGMDVRPHPHINLATVTYLFDGAVEHRDSIGSHAVIEPGAINLMTARRGPELLRDADLARAARRQGRTRAGVRPCPGGRTAAGRGRRRFGARADG